LLFEANVDGRSLRVEVKGRDGRYAVTIGDRQLDVDYLETGAQFVSLLVEGKSYDVALEARPTGYSVALPAGVVDVELQAAARGDGAAAHAALGPARLNAPMPGKIVRLLAAPGDEVLAGQGIVVMEAMKMENELRAPRAGRLREIRVAEGQAVESGALLALLE
jgi:biotin carboxyl carrier protein